MNSIQSRSVGTHNGPFHADEVVACALLALFNLIDRSRIVRTRDPKRLIDCEYVCDVGGIYDPGQKRFDHHQVEYQGELSSAGMVLRYLQERGLLDEPQYRYFHESLVHGIDAHDNGRVLHQIGVCTFSHLIASMAPIDYDSSEAQHEEAFFEAFDLTLAHLRRLHDRYLYVIGCRSQVAEAMEKGSDCLMFEHRIPWVENFFALGGATHPAKFVIMPAGEHWKLRGIPPSLEDRMNVRIPLPREWAGLLDDELTEKSGIPGAIFCHKGQFISVWETREAALQALDYTLRQAGCRS